MTSPFVGPYTVTPIALFDDNYAWRVDCASHSLLVDPAEATSCLASYRSLSTPRLVAVLSTHFHNDHAGENLLLADTIPGIDIVGGLAEEGRFFVTRGVIDNEIIEMAGLSITCLHTPCHTRGHMLYYIPGDPGSLFTGDTLFSGGCGRFFEGTPNQMLAALNRIATLPANTRIYCGHEYTVANLHFCALVEPSNKATAERLAECIELRAAGKPTLPSTLAVELATNVFMRTASLAVVNFTHPGVRAEDVDPVEVIARLRNAKNAFKPPIPRLL